MTCDVENRTVSATSGSGTEYYAYGPSNERVWKREEFTGGGALNYVYFYGVDGALLATNGIDDDWDYNVYFAGRTVWRERVSGNSTMPPGAVSPDRLGSVVKHFPYGDEPTTTTPNREKFATYYRDQITALDYARNRYYSSTIARFTTADPYGGSAALGDPRSWNRYSYVGSDPVNAIDPEGLCTVMIAGIMQSPSTTSAFTGAAFGAQANSVYPYQEQNMKDSIDSVIDQATSPNAATQAALQAIRYSLATNSGSVDIVAYSGGAAAFTAAYWQLTMAEQARIGQVLYISPGNFGTVAIDPNSTSVIKGSGGRDWLAMIGTDIPDGVPTTKTGCAHTDLVCLLNAARPVLEQMAQNGSCNDPKVFSQLAPSGTPGYGLPAPGAGGGRGATGSSNQIWWWNGSGAVEGWPWSFVGVVFGTEPGPRLWKLW